MRTGPSLEREDRSAFHCWFSASSSVRVAADHGPVNEVADAHRERNDAEDGDGPDIAVRLDGRNQSKRGDVADGSADQQDAGAPGTRCLIQLRLHRNIDSAG